MAKFHYFLALLCCHMVAKVSGHATPCNQGDDALCLDGVRTEFTRNDTAYWFGIKYSERCPDGPDGSFYCMNNSPALTTIAERLLGDAGKNFNVTTIEQFLRMRYDVPSGSYRSCGHRFTVPAFKSTKDIDNTHTLYYDQWMLDHRPAIVFDYPAGDMTLYTLIAYDAGYRKIGGLWVNIMSADTGTGEEVLPHKGPVNPMWELRNPFVYALFRQKSRITTASSIKAEILKLSKAQNGHFYLQDFITSNDLQGPMAIGYIVVKTDPYGILSYKNKNIFNNCPYLVSKNRDIIKALRVMGFEFNDKNSYSDYRGTFLTQLEVDLKVRYFSEEAHFDSCCKHVTIRGKDMKIDPFDDTPTEPVYLRAAPDVYLTTVEMRNSNYFEGELFTLFLLDVTEAAVNATDADTVIHWQVMNIPGHRVDKGDAVLRYMPPIIQSNVTRQFLFLLLKQHKRVNPRALWSHTAAECPDHLRSRCGFDFGSFQKLLNFKVVGLSHFRSSQDEFSRAVLYGAIQSNSVAKSMEEFRKRPSIVNHAPMMTKAHACHGEPGFAEPCPAPSDGCPGKDDKDSEEQHDGHNYLPTPI